MENPGGFEIEKQMRKQLQRARMRIEKQIGVCWAGISIQQLRDYSPVDEHESLAIKIRLDRHTSKVDSQKTVSKSSTRESLRNESPGVIKNVKRFDDILDASTNTELSAWHAFFQSNASRTRKFLGHLSRCGDAGKLAAALFRAQKASTRAKAYRSKHKSFAYDRKGELLEDICNLLSKETNSIPWGWGIDEGGYYHDVLYVDLPVGQASFHSTKRFAGPNYQSGWDQTQSTEDNVLAYCELVIESVPPEAKAKSCREVKPKQSFQCFVCRSEKMTSQSKPSGWKWIFVLGEQKLLCSDDCQDGFAKGPGADIYPPNWVFPRGKLAGRKLNEADIEYLQFLATTLKLATSDLCQAASVEIFRRSNATLNESISDRS